MSAAQLTRVHTKTEKERAVSEFIDITITGLDDKQSSATGQGAFWNYVLVLSRNASVKWCDIFNVEWENHFYMQKRAANASGNSLYVSCTPDELQGLINQFKDVASKVNAQYRQMLQDSAAAEEQAKQKYAQQQEELKTLKGSLKF